ncbi:PAXIP1-associated glutamate-rich protein 1 [Petromyzon marinus]|uniref:PAXIP1-associated glutamate-rich protein 1 n=1 Tax=Petromyzon marinus TaxID=7757 RepID=UPI003F6E94D9
METAVETVASELSCMNTGHDDGEQAQQPQENVGEGEKAAGDSDWWMGSSDDEEIKPGCPDWMPSPEQIRTLFECIAKEGSLPLKMTHLPRRPPTPEPQCPDEPEEEGRTEQPDGQKSETLDGKCDTPSEFDFNEELTPKKTNDKKLFSPRRTPGSGGRIPKREARLDKVLSDMLRHKRMDQQLQQRSSQHGAPERDAQTPTTKRSAS